MSRITLFDRDKGTIHSGDTIGSVIRNIHGPKVRYTITERNSDSECVIIVQQHNFNKSYDRTILGNYLVKINS